MEEWKSIKGYEGLYEVSNEGRIKSLKYGKERILKPGVNSNGYLTISLYAGASVKTAKVNHLVWGAFGCGERNGREIQVDHIDGNKLNNNINNLQLLTNRENVSKYFMSKKTTSKYTGVHWYSKSNKWRAKIWVGGRELYIGLFDDEHEAHLAYQKKLKEVKDG